MNTQQRKGPYIQTFTGKRFYPLDIQPGDIDLEDIAHALSNICRFTGHTKHFYSVAQHSVLVSYLVPGQHALAGLLHDASEAYLTDIAKPIKMLAELSEYEALEGSVMQAIAIEFGFDYPLHESIKTADGRMLFTEKRDLLPVNLDWGYELEPYASTIHPWYPSVAKDFFLSRFNKLQP